VADGSAKQASDVATTLGPSERRLLAGMPFHAFTSVHGEAGLREGPHTEIVQFLPLNARGLATPWRWHRGCMRGIGGCVNRMPTTCSGAIRILSHYRASDPDVVCAALLHDAVEDHSEDARLAATDRPPSRCWRGSSANAPLTWWPR
jgi:hypothetical protein